MNIQLTADQISRASFENDPMNTCCKENDCVDEYDRIAADVAEYLETGATLKDALAEATTNGFTTARIFQRASQSLNRRLAG